jgi:hypothetical protein
LSGRSVKRKKAVRTEATVYLRKVWLLTTHQEGLATHNTSGRSGYSQHIRKVWLLTTHQEGLATHNTSGRSGYSQHIRKVWLLTTHQEGLAVHSTYICTVLVIPEQLAQYSLSIGWVHHR